MNQSRSDSKLFIIIRLFVFMALIFSLLGLWVTTAHAAGVVSPCDETHLRSALSGGGTVTFSCDGTITLTSQLTISSNTTLDGAGRTVAIRGNSGIVLFYVDGFASSVTFNLKNITLQNANNSVSDGGGIYNETATVNVTNVVFSDNRAANGAAIFNESGTLNVTDSTFLDNHSDSSGGGIFNDIGILTVTNSTFSGNSAREGGAISSQGYEPPDISTVVVANSTFNGNSVSVNSSFGLAGRGGAIQNKNYSNLYVTNSTFTGNSAPFPPSSNYGYGSASGIQNSEDSTVTLKNTILANSTSSLNCYNLSDTFTDGGGNLEDRNDCGFTEITSRTSTNPMLGAQGGYGGSTQTFPLLPGSPAIDSAVSTICAAAVGSPNYGAGTKDQRGVTRPSACDIGAFESKGFTFTKTGGDNQDTQINTAFAHPLALSVASAFSEPVNGGKVTFTPPASGASAAVTGSPATITGGGVSVTAAANGTPGSYDVVASASGATNVHFALENELITTTTLLGSSLNPSSFGQSVLFTSTITPSAATGTVTFQDGGVDIPGCAGASVSAGQSTCTTARLAPGMHTITADYNGDANYGESTGTLSPDQQVNCLNAITVSNNTDNDPGSLRQAIVGICAGRTIDFDNAYTILLTSELAISKDLTIDGTGHKITVSGNHVTRVFNISAGQVTFDSLTIADGNVQTSDCGSSSDLCGGGMMLQNGSENVTVKNSTFRDNSANFGGGIYNEGTLMLANTTFSGNSAHYGGGLVNVSNLTSTNSTFSGNSGTNNGGGINNGGTLHLFNTLIANSPSGGDCYASFGSIAGEHNLIETDGSGGGHTCGTTSPINSDPLLTILAG